MRRSLRSQILYPFAGLTAAAIVAVSVAVAWGAAAGVDARIEAHVRSAADVLLNAGFPLTDAVLAQTRGLAGAEFVCTDSAGEITASGLPVTASIRLAVEDIRPSEARREVRLDGVDFLGWSIARPARNAVDRAVTLHVFYPQEQRRLLLREAIWPPLWIGTAALLFAIIISYVLAARIGRPIAAVREHFAKLAAGDYASLAVPQRDDEVRDLVTAANTLAKRLEERDLAVRRAARASLLGQLSGGLCHHLRNAAAGAKLALQLHRRRCREGDAESLDVALRQLDFAEQYVQRLLTLGKPQPLKLERADLRDVAADALSLVDPACRHKNVELRRDVPPTPVVAEQVDREQLRQLLVNLLLNAVDAAGDAGWVELSIANDDKDGLLRIGVADSGPGPPPEVQARLFEPFVTGKPDGIGLGLAAARYIAQLHGGTMTYARRDATRFELVLPRVGPQSQGDSKVEANSEPDLLTS